MRSFVRVLASLLATAGVAHAGDAELSVRLKGTAAVKRRLDRLAAEPALAAQQLGQDVRIVPLGTRTLPNEKWFDLGKGVMRARGGADRTTLTFKPSYKADQGLTQRIELGIDLKTQPLSGDQLAQGHRSVLGPGMNSLASFAAKPPAFEQGESGGQRARYMVVHQGKRVGQIDLENNYFKTAGKTRGVGVLEFSGRSEHGDKLIDHLGLRPKAGMTKASRAAQALKLR